MIPTLIVIIVLGAGVAWDKLRSLTPQLNLTPLRGQQHPIPQLGYAATKWTLSSQERAIIPFSRTRT